MDNITLGGAVNLDIQETIRSIFSWLADLVVNLADYLMNLRIGSPIPGVSDFMSTIIVAIAVIAILAALIKNVSGFLQKLLSVVLTILVVYVLALSIGAV